MSGRAERFEWLLALRFLREGRLQTLNQKIIGKLLIFL